MIGPGIPMIDVGPLFDPAGASDRRAETDAALGRACAEIGFVVARGLPVDLAPTETRPEALLAFFDLPAAARHRLARRRYNRDARTVYRGAFPVVEGDPSHKEGVDLGPDPPPAGDAGHPLVEANPWPAETALPGFRAHATRYFTAMERLGLGLMRALARYLAWPETWFDPVFIGGNSTLRLLRYPPRPAASLAPCDDGSFRDSQPVRSAIVTPEHTDSGILTLLYQDGVGGLQARRRDGGWVDVPPIAGSYVVNLGDMLERWTDGRLRATEHRVLGGSSERFSIPFFLEPAMSALIEAPPASQGRGAPMRPLVYGDYLLEKIRSFEEFRDLGGVA